MSVVLRIGYKKRFVLEQSEAVTMMYIVNVINNMEFKESIVIQKLVEYVNELRDKKKLVRFSKRRITISIYTLAYFDILRVYQNKAFRNIYPGKNYPPQKIIYMINDCIENGHILNYIQELKKLCDKEKELKEEK